MRVLALVIALLAADGVSAQTKPEKNALDALIGAALFSEKCGLLRLNIQTYETLMKANGIEAKDLTPDGRFSAYVAEARAEVLDKIMGEGVKDICTLGFALYGPHGIGVANILTQRG